jgi:acyl-CoA dehydrogenase family member 9
MRPWDIYAQVATLSRVTAIFDDQGADASGQECYIANAFCSRAAGRVSSVLDQVDDNDDDRMHSIARLAYNRGEYDHRLFG